MWNLDWNINWDQSIQPFPIIFWSWDVLDFLLHWSDIVNHENKRLCQVARICQLLPAVCFLSLARCLAFQLLLQLQQGRGKVFGFQLPPEWTDEKSRMWRNSFTAHFLPTRIDHDHPWPLFFWPWAVLLRSFRSPSLLCLHLWFHNSSDGRNFKKNAELVIEIVYKDVAAQPYCKNCWCWCDTLWHDTDEII